MVSLGIVRPSNSPWASPVYMVAKKNGDWRPCGDYHALNQITVPENYPFSHIKDLSLQLNGKRLYSKLNLVRAHHQIPLAPEDFAKTAVITPFGLFENLRILFGLRNAALTFQRFIDQLLHGLEFDNAYIDEVLMASSNAEEHKLHLRQVFQRL